MTKELFISSSPHETKVAVLEDDQLVEVYYERDVDVGLVGSVYKGRVSRVLPGMQSAFVNIGLERDAFLYVSDFYEDEEEYDKVFSEAEARATRFAEEPQAGASGVATSEVGPAIGVPPPEMPEAAAAQPGPATPAGVSAAPSSTTPGPARPAGESTEGPRYDPRSRRHHRRGRKFGDRKIALKFGSRERAADRRDATAPQAFEILPGESLAKYRDTTAGAPHEDPAASVPLAQETPRNPSDTIATGAATAPEAAAETGAELLRSSSSGVQTGSAPAPGEPTGSFVDAHARPQPDLPPAPPSEELATEANSETPTPSEFEVGIGTQAVPTDAIPSPPDAVTAEVGPAQAEGRGVEPAASAETVPPKAGEPAEAVASGEESAAVVDESELWPELQPPALTADGGEFCEGAVSPDAATSSPQPLSPTGEPLEHIPAAPTEPPTEAAERTYTLREPYQRPRFAPRRRGRRGLAQRPARGERHEPGHVGNRQPVQISDLLKEGQEILVQIAKEPLGGKGARVTSHIALPGRYLVYMPTINHIGVSRKITSEEERLRLRNIILENRGSLTGGFIVRTAGHGRSEEEFKADLKFLSTLWNEIKAKAERTKAPALLHRDLDLVQRILRDTLSPDFKLVRVDSEAEYERTVEFVSRCQPSLVGHVKLYTRDTPMFEEFGIQAEVDKALKPKVWLKSGGYIVINQTEALVAIDVNTGKYVGKTNRLEDTIVRTNIDAVNEIVRQIRLRDLGGIIVIDFIDMDERRNRVKVVQALEEALRRDRAPTKILSFNDFGLVALTRKRVKQSLERTLCQPCPHCSGSGWIKSVTSVCSEIVAEVKKMAKELEGDTVTLRVHPEVAQALKSRQGTLVAELESLTRKDIIIKSDPTVHQERFEIY